MTAQTLLADLQGRGAVFVPIEGDRLRWRAPAGVITADDAADIQAHKVELLCLLVAPPIAEDTFMAPTAPSVIEPGVLHVEVDPDASFMAGHLSDADTTRASGIVAYIRERGVLITACASGEEILLVLTRPIAPPLLTRIAANAALLRAYMACPHCGRRHSLSPPSGWCWPCAEEARLGAPGPCAFAKPDIHDLAPADGTADAETQEEN